MVVGWLMGCGCVGVGVWVRQREVEEMGAQR